MKKIRNLICILIIICSISTVSFAKGTVTGSGTNEDPYKLVMGEGIIDINYGNDLNFYFQFTGGDVNAGNYLVEHNPDKKRVRFTLIGTTEEDRVVVSSEGINYIQAGAITKTLSSGDAEKVQTPYYKIVSCEKLKGKRTTGLRREEQDLEHQENLANGYIRINDTLGANVSNYATSYIFSKTGLDYDTAYEITSEQIKNNALMKLVDKPLFHIADEKNKGYVEDRMAPPGETGAKYILYGPVDIVYRFYGTSSEIANSDGEPASFIEKLLSKVFLAVGDGAVSIMGLGGDKEVDVEVVDENGNIKDKKLEITETYITIDSLVFNEYAKTIVDLWGKTKYTNSIAQKMVGFWYKVFQTWAVIAFIILLIATGIRVVLSSGTPEEKNTKQVIEGWIIGVFMLFCLPFLFKYMVKVNDVLVDIVRTNSKYSVYAYYTFQEDYEEDAEIGEDSTTDVISQLQRSKEFWEKKLQSAEDIIETERKKYELALADLESGEKEAKDFEMKAKNSLEIFYDAHRGDSLVRDTGAGNYITYTVDEIYQDLLKFAENRFGTLELERDANGNLIFPSEEMQKYNEDVEKYKETFFVFDVDGNEQTKTEEFRNRIELTSRHGAMGSDVGVFDAFGKKIIANTFKRDLEETENAIALANQKIASAELAIQKAENSDALDIIGMLRLNAGKTYKLLYVFVWLVLVFQIILLLIVYYKRLFMISILICVFPLVALSYTYEKIRGTKSSIFKNWMQEYTINVFIQTIHAIIYVTLVELGYTVYMANNDNWLIFLIAVFSLLTVEPIFKSLLGIKGNSVKDLKASAANLALSSIAVAKMGGMIINTPKDMKNIDTAYKNKEANIEAKHEKHDKRTETARRALDNHKTKNGKSLEGRHNFDSKFDEFKSKARKNAARKRKIAKYVKQGSMIPRNIVAAAGAFASGVASGGEAGDFAKGSSFVNAINSTGTGEKLTGEAKERDDRIKEENKLGNVSTENGNTRSDRTIAYAGPSYDDYMGDGSYGGNGSGGAKVTIGGNGTGAPGSEESTNKSRWKDPKLAAAFSEQLAQTKRYINSKPNIINSEIWNEHEEDE